MSKQEENEVAKNRSWVGHRNGNLQVAIASSPYPVVVKPLQQPGVGLIYPVLTALSPLGAL